MTTLSLKQKTFIQTTFLLTFFLFVSMTNKNQATLEINIKDCRYNELEYLNQLTVLKDNKKIKVLKPEYNNKQTITNLDTGTYFLEYESIFGKTEKLKVQMTEFKKYSVDLCIDYIDYSKETYKPVIDQLQDNENYKILIFTQGCFGGTADSLTIFRKDNSYFVTWTNKTKNLTQSDIDAIRHFEIQLNYMIDGGCTTTDTYYIVYKDNKKKIEDGSCRWNGRNYLKKQFWDKQ